MSSKKLPLSWPPIIYSKSIPVWVRIRDVIITLLAWALLIYILYDFWRLIYDYFSEPLFHLTEEQTPDWDEIWKRISKFAYIAVGLIIWIICIGIFRMRIIQHTRFSPAPLLQVEDKKIALEFGFSLVQMEKWHALRAVNVFVNDKSIIEKIEPCDADLK